MRFDYTISSKGACQAPARQAARLTLSFISINLVLLNTAVYAGTAIKFDQNGHWYESLDSNICQTWTEAKDYAATTTYLDPDTNVLLQGHLVTIQDLAEDAFISTNFIPSAFQQMWIGVFQSSHDGALYENWEWITGEEWAYTNWDGGEPSAFDEDYSGKLNYYSGKWHDFPNTYNELNCGYLFTVIEYEPPIYSCSGFEPPMDKIVMAKKKNRVLPLKMILVDHNGVEAADLTARPIVEVDFTSGDPTNPAEEGLFSAGKGGKGDQGNQFVYRGSKWAFNLKTSNFSGPGTYTVTVVSGDPKEYSISPTCKAEFVVAP